MTPRPPRGPLAALGIAAVLALGLAACSSNTPAPPPQAGGTAAVTTNAPIILAPRTKDIVGTKFTVAGTYSDPQVTIRVDVLGPYSDHRTATSQPHWVTSEFDSGTTTGDHSASAAADRSVNFTIEANPPIAFKPPSVVIPAGGPAATVTVSGTHTGTNPTIAVSLFKDDTDTPYKTKDATVTGANWTVTFDQVDLATCYAAQAALRADPNRKTSSQFIVVGQ